MNFGSGPFISRLVAVQSLVPTAGVRVENAKAQTLGDAKQAQRASSVSSVTGIPKVNLHSGTE